jgi:hypothetical protein
MKTLTESNEGTGAVAPAAPCSPLFEDRVPEAAATQLAVAQLAVVLAWLTECNLATLEEMLSRKSTPKYSIARQESICEKAVEHCRDMKVPPRGLRGQTTTRLARILRENDQGLATQPAQQMPEKHK